MTNTDPSFRLAKMTSPEVRAQIVNGRTTVVVPFGAVEQHGPHLPLATDAILGDHLGAMIAERLNGFWAPTIPIGCSKHQVAFPGTLSIRPETLRMIVHDLVESLVGHGFRRIVLLPTHGGNEEPLKRAATESKRDCASASTTYLQERPPTTWLMPQGRHAPADERSSLNTKFLRYER